MAATTDSPPNLFQSEPITSPLIEICAPKCACETCVPMTRRAGRCRTTDDTKIAAPTGELNSPFLVTLSEGLFEIFGFDPG